MKRNLMRIALLLIVLETGLSSCKKSIIEKDDDYGSTAKTTLNVKAPKDFKWNTVHSLNLNIKPIAGDGRVEVLILTFDDGVVLYQKLQKASLRQNILLEIPAQYSKVNVHFGSIVKVFDAKNTFVEMDLN